MAATCNIDSRGRRFRAIAGFAMVIIGVAITATAHNWGAWRWPTACVAISLGLFGLYEAWRGWCAVRAMGFRTPI